MKVVLLKAKKSYQHQNGRRYRATKSRIYFWFRGETIIDHLFNRHHEPIKLIREVIPDALEQVGLDRKLKFRFSQKAGCSCGCSPGFILSDHWNYDIHLTIDWEPTTEAEHKDLMQQMIERAKEAGKRIVRVGEIVGIFPAPEESSLPEKLDGFLPIKIEAS